MSRGVYATGVGAFGYKMRRATADEQIGGTNPVDGTYVARACSARCVAPVEYVGLYYLTGVDHRPRLHRRFLCTHHAERFARRHQVALPPPLTTDQSLLPFYAEKGEAHGDSDLSL